MHCIISHWNNLIVINHSLWISHQLTLTNLVEAPNILFVFSQAFYFVLFLSFSLMKFSTAFFYLVLNWYSACLSFLWLNSISWLRLPPLSICLLFAFYLEAINHFKVKWIALLPATHRHTRTGNKSFQSMSSELNPAHVTCRLVTQ